MKKIYFLCLILATSLVVSCSKDDDGNALKENFLSFENKNYAIREGIIDYPFPYDTVDTITEYQFSFSTKAVRDANVYLYSDPENPVDIDSINADYFEIKFKITSEEIKLQKGIYEYNETSSKPKSFQEGIVITNHYTKNETEEIYTVSKGKVDIIHSENENNRLFELKFSFTLSNNEIVKGYYKGFGAFY